MGTAAHRFPNITAPRIRSFPENRRPSGAGFWRRTPAALVQGWQQWRRIVLGCAVLLAGTLQPARGAELSDEYDIKAALLYNFTQFVDWPPLAFDDPNAQLVIGIIGRDPFGATLERLVEHERVAGRRILVQQCRTMAEASRCQILFIGVNQQVKLEQIVRELNNRPILTVAEFDGFLNRGGMVRLYRNPQNKIRVRINLEAVRAASLTISAKLLRVVEVIPEDEE